MELRIPSKLFLALVGNTAEVRLADSEHYLEIDSPRIEEDRLELIGIRYDQGRDQVVALVSGGEGEVEVTYRRGLMTELRDE